tara:strand:+ start:397 stop:684 length:288 start_codon:yes stop_codon:yes gene_type:complete
MLIKQYLLIALAYLVECSLILISLLFTILIVYAGGEALKQEFIVIGLLFISLGLLPLGLVPAIKDINYEIYRITMRINDIKRHRTRRNRPSPFKI